MNTKHTPGPWMIFLSGHIASASVRTPETTVAHPGTIRGQTIGEAMANARLIAAAPELLVALNALVAWMDASELSKTKPGGVGAFRYEGHEYSVVTQARAAIARATGELTTTDKAKGEA